MGSTILKPSSPPRRRYPVGRHYKMLGPYLWPFFFGIHTLTILTIDSIYGRPFGLEFAIFLAVIFNVGLFILIGRRIKDESKIRTLELNDRGIYVSAGGLKYGRMSWKLIKDIRIIPGEYAAWVVADIEKLGGANRWPKGMVGKDPETGGTYIIVPCPTELGTEDFRDLMFTYLRSIRGDAVRKYKSG